MELLSEETESSPDASGGSSQSSILTKTTVANLSQTTLGKSDSSRRSRVKVKRKYLKERLSPFDVCQSSQAKDAEIIPPALLGTLSKDYQEIAERLSGSLSAQTGHVTRSPDLAVASTSSSHFVQKQAAISGEGSSVSSFSNLRQAQTKLKQGSPNRAEFSSCDPHQANDVRITQYAPGKRKQIMKESLSKRPEQIGPVRRVFEPHFVNERKMNAAADSGPDVNQVAATAAAAVAATAPLIKYQHDLENKVSMILNKLHDLEENTRQRRGRHPSHPEAVVNEELQRRLDELTLMKLKELERLHTQPTQIIEDADPRGNDVLQPSKSIQSSSSIKKDKRGLNRTGSEYTIYSGYKHPLNGVERNSSMNKLAMGELRDEAPPTQLVKQVHYAPAMKIAARGGVPDDDCHGYNARLSQQQQDDNENEQEKDERRRSPLDTPAPRKHAPVPHSISPTTRPNGGFLQEILSHQGATMPLGSHDVLTQEKRVQLPSQ